MRTWSESCPVELSFIIQEITCYWCSDLKSHKPLAMCERRMAANNWSQSAKICHNWLSEDCGQSGWPDPMFCPWLTRSQPNSALLRGCLTLDLVMSLFAALPFGTLRPLLGFGTQECLPFPNIADDRFRLLFISSRKNFQRPCCATPQITFRHRQSLSDSPSIKLVVGIYINCILTINLYILTSELGELFYLFYIPVFSFRLTFLRSAVRLCVL